VFNGEKAPVRGPTSGVVYTNLDLPGPVYLQGDDHTMGAYRNIYLEPVNRKWTLPWIKKQSVT